MTAKKQILPRRPANTWLLWRFAPQSHQCWVGGESREFTVRIRGVYWHAVTPRPPSTARRWTWSWSPHTEGAGFWYSAALTMQSVIPRLQQISFFSHWEQRLMTDMYLTVAAVRLPGNQWILKEVTVLWNWWLRNSSDRLSESTERVHFPQILNAAIWMYAFTTGATYILIID